MFGYKICFIQYVPQLVVFRRFRPVCPTSRHYVAYLSVNQHSTKICRLCRNLSGNVVAKSL